MGRDGSKKLKVAQIKPLRSGTFGCSHTSRREARKTGAFVPIRHGILPQCGAFVVFELPTEQRSDRRGRAAIRPCRLKLFSQQPIAELAADDGSQNWRHPEQPDLRQRLAASVDR